MAGKNTAVFGIYRDRAQVEQAVDALVGSGFRPEDISVLLPDNVGTKDFAHEKHTKAPEGATAGAGTGVVVGGTLGLLAGLRRSADEGKGGMAGMGCRSEMPYSTLHTTPGRCPESPRSSPFGVQYGPKRISSFCPNGPGGGYGKAGAKYSR